MTMAETEADVLRDLRELGDDMSCYAYLMGCAREERGYPDELRTEEYRVRDCQGLTCVMPDLVELFFSFPIRFTANGWRRHFRIGTTLIPYAIRPV